MTTGDWVAVVLGIAGLLVGAAAIPKSRLRPLILTSCVLLVGLALAIGLYSPKDDQPTGGVMASGAPTAPPATDAPAFSSSSTSAAGQPPAAAAPSAPGAVPPGSFGDALGVPLLGGDAPPNTLVSESGPFYLSRTDVSINGQKAKLAMGACCSGGSQAQQATILMTLGRSYSTFRARIGATDRTRTNDPVTISIYSVEGAGARLIYQKAFRVGESEDVALNVTDVLQMKFVFAGPLGNVYAGVGDPTVYH